ncbi:MAG: cation diffusion facilitator family transporter [Chloroflexota bacterium]|nr:cation diffusion facilitator family transporter [Chloroflexota bacterium]
MTNRAALTRYAWLSIGAALATISLKALAYFITGSVSLLSDALESLVNLVAAVFALWALHVAAQPPDDEHEFGHDKVEFFSSGIEGVLILFAAGSIALTSVQRLLSPQPLESINLGLILSLSASVINGVVAWVLLNAGRRHDSITLEADGRHLLTDVWTSVGVVIGIAAVSLTEAYWLDPVVALLVAVNIVVTGVRLVRRSADGLMDRAVSGADRAAIEAVLEGYKTDGMQYHALRTRCSGARRFISIHILVPGGWTVQRGHNLLERIEQDIRAVIPNAVIGTHLEPLGDPAAMADIVLDRSEGGEDS